MALILTFILALLLLDSEFTSSLGCDLPQIQNLGLESLEKNEEGALMLLEKMRRIPSFYCLNYRKDFAFPQEQMDGEQLDDLKACVTQQVEVEEAPLRALRKYFHRLTVYLKGRKYLPCAWEVVRAEIVRSFSSSANLYERLRSKEWSNREMILTEDTPNHIPLSSAILKTLIVDEIVT
ncbi:Interferon alpha-16 [Sciurus carolinensis]|uniref:Interferon alpha-16 n=1 Tax=Sciurus carolinensis TaxID=30640 RepID=A0AA41N4V4_SCICA|nr:Interferon alpha-16 [Sciurus carolinensis]